MQVHLYMLRQDKRKEREARRREREMEMEMEREREKEREKIKRETKSGENLSQRLSQSFALLVHRVVFHVSSQRPPLSGCMHSDRNNSLGSLVVRSCA